VTRVLPDEAAHSQYEMRSFVRSDSGVLYPTGKGRLAEPSNPEPPASHPLPHLAAPVNLTGNVPDIFPKAARPKLVKVKSKGKQSTAKGAHAAIAQTITGVTAYPEVLPSGMIERQAAVASLEDEKARQSRLDTYDDAIESVLRRVLKTEGDVLYEQIVSDFGQEPFVRPMVAAAGRSSNQECDEREAQIASTIDAVIARTFHDSDQSPSPPPPPVASPPPCEDEDEIIEVHSVSPVRVEVTTDDVLILPPPSPPAASPIPVQTMAERKIILGEVTDLPALKRSRKPKNQQPASAASSYDNEDDFGWPKDQGRGLSTEIPSRLKFGIPESYVKLEELPGGIQTGEQIIDDRDAGGQPLPMDAVESLMKLAGVPPPPKRLRISYGSGRDRTIEETHDGSGEDLEIYDQKADYNLGIDNFDTDSSTRRSTASELLTEVKMADESANIVEPLYERPPGKKGRPRKEQKKRDRVQKAAVSDSC